MAFCPQCGAPTNASMTFCTACGRTLEPAAPAAAPAPDAGAAAPPGFYTAPPAPAAAPAPAGPARPVGKTVKPWHVILFAFLTIGIYPYFLWWRTSREVDAVSGSRSRPLVIPGVLASALGTLFGIVVGAIAFTRAFEQVMADPEAPFDAESFTVELASHPLYLGSIVLALVGAALLFTGLYRMWRAMAAEEAALGRADVTPANQFVGIGIGAALASSLSAGLTLLATTESSGALDALGSVLSFASFALGIAMFYVMYATQKRLNELWQALSPRPPAGPW